MHNADKPEKCDQCKFSCHYPSRLKLHILQKHEGKQAPFKCKECTAGFYTENTLRSHMLRHGPRNYECLVSECDWKFYTRAHLINHGKKVHKLDFSSDAPKIKIKGRSKPDIKEYKPSKKFKTTLNRKQATSKLQHEVDQEIPEICQMEVEYLEEAYSDIEEEIKCEIE